MLSPPGRAARTFSLGYALTWLAYRRQPPSCTDAMPGQSHACILGPARPVPRCPACLSAAASARAAPSAWMGSPELHLARRCGDKKSGGFLLAGVVFEVATSPVAPSDIWTASDSLYCLCIVLPPWAASTLLPQGSALHPFLTKASGAHK